MFSVYSTAVGVKLRGAVSCTGDSLRLSHTPSTFPHSKLDIATLEAAYRGE